MSLSLASSCLKQGPETSSSTLISGSVWVSMPPSYTNAYSYAESLTALISSGTIGTGIPLAVFVCPYQS
jgi:hypothetical protein